MKLNFVCKIVSVVLLIVNLVQLQVQNCKDLETRLSTQLEDTSKVLLLDELVKCLNDVNKIERKYGLQLKDAAFILQREDSLRRQQTFFEIEKLSNASAAQLKELEVHSRADLMLKY